jgi:hypothetical protein
MMWLPLVLKMADVVACLSSEVGVLGAMGRVGMMYLVSMGEVMSTRLGLSSKRETTKRKWLKGWSSAV